MHELSHAKRHICQAAAANHERLHHTPSKFCLPKHRLQLEATSKGLFSRFVFLFGGFFTYRQRQANRVVRAEKNKSRHLFDKTLATRRPFRLQSDPSFLNPPVFQKRIPTVLRFLIKLHGCG